MLRWQKIVVVGIISAALFFLDKVGFFNYGVWLARNFVVSPITRVFTYVGEESFFIFKNIFGVRGLIKENMFLKGEVKFFRGEYFKLSNISQENEFLRQALNLGKENENKKLILASILSFDPFQANDIFLIDKGKQSGIEENNSVILSGNIVVGRVKKVGEKDSEILLITSSQSKITAVSEDDKAKGVISGSASGVLALDLVLKDVELKRGQIFMTSGLDGFFRRGLLIGELSETTSSASDSFQKASIRPFFNLRDLKQVFIVVSK
jgi:rod shape-determining protein MreC